MKRNNIIGSLLIVGAFAIYIQKATAQITVDSADLNPVGKTLATGNDTTSSSFSRLSAPTTGANVTWNYSFLPTSYTSTDAFVKPSSTPFGSSFPSATIADSTYGTSGYSYMSLTGHAYSSIGYVTNNYSGKDIPAHIKPGDTLLSLPAHYGDHGFGTDSSIVLYPYVQSGSDSVQENEYSFYWDTIDGYGSITTPGGSQYNTLLQKEFERDSVKLYVHFEHPTPQWVLEYSGGFAAYNYTWYANGIGTYLASMTVDSTNTKPNGFYWYKGNVTGINEVAGEQNGLMAYPNPCVNEITFQNNQLNAKYICVYDITGRQLEQKEVDNNSQLVLNTSDYSSGMYIYHVTDKAGNIIGNGKFTVQK